MNLKIIDKKEIKILHFLFYNYNYNNPKIIISYYYTLKKNEALRFQSPKLKI